MYRAKNDTENLGWGEKMYPAMRMFQPDGVGLRRQPLVRNPNPPNRLPILDHLQPSYFMAIALSASIKASKETLQKLLAANTMSLESTPSKFIPIPTHFLIGNIILSVCAQQPDPPTVQKGGYFGLSLDLGTSCMYMYLGQATMSDAEKEMGYDPSQDAQ